MADAVFLLFYPIKGIHLFMMLRHNGEVDEVMVGEVLHVVGVSLRTVMALSYPDCLGYAVIVECSHAADDEHYRAVALMFVASAGCARAEG